MMQTLKACTLVFCFACVLAELLTQTTGSAGAQKCIKAVAGLYIIVSVLHAVQGVRFAALSLPETAAGGDGVQEDYEQNVLTETAARLEQTMEQALLRQGCDAAVSVRLSKEGGTVWAAEVTVTPRTSLTEAQRQAAAALLSAQLGTENVLFLEEEQADDNKME